MDASYPYGYGGPNANFALLTDRYMQEYGATREDFGRICVAQRFNALRNPGAVMKKPLTMDQYMQARPIADPIALFDCVMPCAGSEAFLVMTIDEAEKRNLPYATLCGAIERHNAHADDPIQLRGGWTLDIDELWEMSRLGPDAMDLVQFTRVVKEAVPFDERVEVIEAVWRVIYADGDRDYEESALVRKLCGLLYVPDRDAGLARQRVVAGPPV